MLNRWVLSWDWKTATEGTEVTRSGRLFQTRAAATGKARSPMVDSRVWLTINEDELERSHWRASTSATWQSSSVRYAGADPWRHYTRTALHIWMQSTLGSSASEAGAGAEWCAGTLTKKKMKKWVNVPTKCPDGESSECETCGGIISCGQTGKTSR